MRRRGFTLVEIGVTLVVLGLLVGISVPTYAAFVRQANANTTGQYAAAYALKVVEQVALARQVTPTATLTNCAVCWVDAVAAFDDVAGATVDGQPVDGTVVVDPSDGTVVFAQAWGSTTYTVTLTVTGETITVGEPTEAP